MNTSPPNFTIGPFLGRTRIAYFSMEIALRGEMPYVPLIMLMSVYTARSVAQIKMLQAIRNEMEHIKNIAMIKQAKIDDDLKKVVNRVSRQSGLN